MNQPAYDKYDPISGGSRIKLNAALPLTNGAFFGAVSINASGRAVVGTGGQSGLFGVCIKNVARGPAGQWATQPFNGTPNPYAPIGAMAGDVIDVMQNGDIVGLDTTAFPVGSKLFAATDGTISVTSGTGKFQIGWVVNKSVTGGNRAVIRIAPGLTPVA